MRPQHALSCLVFLLAASSLAWSDTLRVPQDHPTVAAAVAAAKDGDVVEISAGVASELIQITSKDLTLRGMAPSQGVQMSGVVANGADVLVENLHLFEGRVETFDGLLTFRYTALTRPLISANSIERSNVVMDESWATLRDGGVNLNSLRMRHSVVSYAGGPRFHYFLSGLGSLQVENCSFPVLSFSAMYPEIRFRDSTVQLTSTSFSPSSGVRFEGAESVELVRTRIDMTTRVLNCDSFEARDSEIKGLEGRPSTCGPSQFGGGCQVTALPTAGEIGLGIFDCGDALLLRCEIEGGTGGWSGPSACLANPPFCPAVQGGQGGTALEVDSDAPMTVHVVATDVVPGPGGPSGPSGVQVVEAGEASVVFDAGAKTGLSAR